MVLAYFPWFLQVLIWTSCHPAVPSPSNHPDTPSAPSTWSHTATPSAPSTRRRTATPSAPWWTGIFWDQEPNQSFLSQVILARCFDHGKKPWKKPLQSCWEHSYANHFLNTCFHFLQVHLRDEMVGLYGKCFCMFSYTWIEKPPVSLCFIKMCISLTTSFHVCAGHSCLRDGPA